MNTTDQVPAKGFAMPRNTGFNVFVPNVSRSQSRAFRAKSNHLILIAAALGTLRHPCQTQAEETRSLGKTK